jgi:hypothetical protein
MMPAVFSKNAIINLITAFGFFSGLNKSLEYPTSQPQVALDFWKKIMNVVFVTLPERSLLIGVKCLLSVTIYRFINVNLHSFRNKFM